jgi:hypothetical protein
MRARGKRELEELLVVGIRAAGQRGALGIAQHSPRGPDDPPRFGQPRRLQPLLGHFLRDRVAEHSLELRLARRVQVDLGLLRGDRRPDVRHRGIVERQPVEPYVRVEYEAPLRDDYQLRRAAGRTPDERVLRKGARELGRVLPRNTEHQQAWLGRPGALRVAPLAVEVEASGRVERLLERRREQPVVVFAARLASRVGGGDEGGAARPTDQLVERPVRLADADDDFGEVDYVFGPAVRSQQLRAQRGNSPLSMSRASSLAPPMSTPFTNTMGKVGQPVHSLSARRLRQSLK